MSKFEINPSRGMRAWAAVLAIVGIGSLVFSHRASARIMAAVILLTAWEMAFVPTLPLNLRLDEIYQKARGGWRMSPIARAINLASIALIIVSIYLQLHGR